MLENSPPNKKILVPSTSEQDAALGAGKAPGILATTESQARQWLAAGALFVAVGVDTMLLASAAQDLLARFRTEATTPAVRPLGY